MFGTDLGSAFAPYNTDNEVISPFLQDEPQQKYQIQQPQQPSSMTISHKSTPIVNLQQQNNGGSYTQTQPSMQQPLLPPQISSQQTPTTMVSSKAYTPSYGLQQGQEDPRLVMLVNELRKQQKLTQNIQNQTSYLEKLFSKKKEVLRIIYFALIIVLAMSLHFVIDHYMKFYLKNNDLSFERESIIRLLYPVSLIFILWNMKVFIK
jgi:uncharacterized phage infection (PIP) family protein YhgE